MPLFFQTRFEYNDLEHSGRTYLLLPLVMQLLVDWKANLI